MAIFKFVDDVTEELLQCPVSREAHKTPKMRPCMHTFCERCLRRREFETRVGVDGRRRQLRCPVWRAAVPGRSDVVESLPAGICEENVLFGNEIKRVPKDSTKLTSINKDRGRENTERKGRKKYTNKQRKKQINK